MTRKLLSGLIPQAESYLANSGCGSGTNYTSSQVAGLMASFALKVLSLPPAEGAEEILKKHMNGRAVQEYKEELFIEYNTVVAAMQEFATLHAQRIAEKMVSERLREELIAYTKHGQKKSWMLRITVRPEYYIDEYLKTREK